MPGASIKLVSSVWSRVAVLPGHAQVEGICSVPKTLLYLLGVEDAHVGISSPIQVLCLNRTILLPTSQGIVQT